jgi:HPr kinase/phosphorylase
VPTPTIANFFLDLAERLGLEWRHQPQQQRLDEPLERNPEQSRVGHLNLIHPHRIQIIGPSELAWLERLGPHVRFDTLTQLLAGGGSLFIHSNGIEPHAELLQIAQLHETPVMVAEPDSRHLIEHLQYYLARLLAHQEVVHGVFIEVWGVGVLLCGESAIGKSELALELITRGHSLVADDAPNFSRQTPETIIGQCPPILRNFLEVRGLGLLNIAAMYGDWAIRDGMPLDLIIKLAPYNEEMAHEMDRLRGNRGQRTICEIAVPEIVIPVAPGRNLAVLVEAAARNHLLSCKGYDAAEAFISRQQSAILQQNPTGYP